MGIIKSVKSFIAGQPGADNAANNSDNQNNFSNANNNSNLNKPDNNYNSDERRYHPASYNAKNQYDYYKNDNYNKTANNEQVPQYYQHEFDNEDNNTISNYVAPQENENTNSYPVNYAEQINYANNEQPRYTDSYRYQPQRYQEEIEETIVSKNDSRASKYFYQPQNYRTKNNSLRLTKDYVNKIMPLEIAREIRAEKIRSIIMIVFGIIGSLAAIYFITYYFIERSRPNIIPNFIWINPVYIPGPLLTIAILIICIGILLSGSLSMSKVKLDANNYISNLNVGNHTIPHFLIENYKRMIVRSIILNWIAFPIYIFGGVILGILYGFQQHAGQTFMFGFWSWGVISDLRAAITINIVVLISMLALHIINIINTKKRKINIYSYYGYEIVSPEELRALKKRTNRICLVIFLILVVIITLIISIPWIISHRRQKKTGGGIIHRIFGR